MYLLLIQPDDSTVWMSSPDFGGSATLSVNNVHSYQVDIDREFVVQIREGSGKSLWLSTDAGKKFVKMNYTPTRAEVSFSCCSTYPNKLNVLDYWLISDIDGAYMIAVEHFHPTLGRVADLYTSDKPENQFLLSLMNVPAYVVNSLSLL